MKVAFSRAVRQFSDAMFYFFIPAVAALLPWRLAFRLLRAASGLALGIFDEPAKAASSVAPRYVHTEDTRLFARHVRLNWLIDTCDLYVSMLRRNRRSLPSHVRQRGRWPDAPFVAAGFHYGNGLWVFRSLAAAGFDSALVSARWSRSDFPGVPVRYAYGRLRGGEAARLSSNDVIYRPGVRDQLGAVLANGDVVVSVLDMPPRLAPRGQKPVRLLGQPVSFPDGTLELARNAGVPLVPFWTTTDFCTGVRQFIIGDPIDPHDAGALQQLATTLDRIITEQPSCWYFWPELDRWIEDARASWPG